MLTIEQEELGEKSAYNEGMLQIGRLNELWVKIESLLHTNDSNLTPPYIQHKWNIILDSVWRELSADLLRMRETDGKKADRFEQKNRMLRLLFLQSKKLTKKYYYLNQRHELMKALQDSSGKGGRYERKDGADFE